MKNFTIVARRTAIAGALLALGLAGTTYAQTATVGPGAGVQTPKGGTAEDIPRRGDLPGKSTTSTMPDETPKSPNENVQLPGNRGATPGGSAMAPNPKTPRSPNEQGGSLDPHSTGTTQGTAPSGTTRSDKSY